MKRKIIKFLPGALAWTTTWIALIFLAGTIFFGLMVLLETLPFSETRGVVSSLFEENPKDVLSTISGLLKIGLLCAFICFCGLKFSNWAGVKYQTYSISQ